MRKGTSILLTIFCFIFSLEAQQKHHRIVNCHRIDSKIEVDGRLDEEAWSSALPISDFTTWQPSQGLPAENKADVRMMYDDNSIYIGAHLIEQSREKVSVQLTQRDRVGNSDWFGVIIDTYGNAQSAFEFIVGSSGVQFDAILGDNGEDTNWDAVWFSAVNITNEGWFAEIRIPYSALRFAKADVQKWNLNFIRRVNRTQEKSSWYPIDQNQGVWLAQMGQTEGLTNIKPPLRISISPYISAYAQHQSTANNLSTSTGYSYNGGMDLKYGINDAFTLDMTLIPDFGQVQSDDQILNLTPFEVRFDERRQFFTEGVELFSKGNLFYSRRVGGAPIGMNAIYNQIGSSEEVLVNPQNSKLINASKISGRTDGGLGIGVFNGLSNSSHAIVVNTENNTERKIRTSPVTNYNVFVLDQNLKNNSTISLVNTNVTRFGDSFYDANVTGTQFNFKNKEQSWSFSGEGAVSQKYYAESDNEYGLSYEGGVRKISGKFTYGAYYEQTGKNFDPNDLGFQRFGNIREVGIHAVYSEVDSFAFFNRGNFWVNANYSRIIDPNEYSELHLNTGFWMRANNFMEYNLWSNHEPKTKNWFEPRIWGRHFLESSWSNVGIFVGSDTRKRLRLRGVITYMDYHEHNRDGFFVFVNPEWQVSDKFAFEIETEYDFSKRDPRFVDIINGDEVIFGRRNRTTVVNSINAAYTFTDLMSIDFRLRHYWSKVHYDGFNLLMEDGTLGDTDYDQFNDFSFGLINVDLNFRWRFAPGSDMIINWKNNIAGRVDDRAFDYSERSYFDDLGSLSSFPENNSVSVRLVYYLDYQQFTSFRNRL
ncbi:DUF5916 domain-containing protein [Portibacter marinus]|uniref:DUF5916 domain-containing protein n=1 Tax=Portibacter marinus TaxID=2898660 RepID=UPI001F3EE02F|nr:DUF5916 domain-containing protein [Portibacter marinus]